MCQIHFLRNRIHQNVYKTPKCDTFILICVWTRGLEPCQILCKVLPRLSPTSVKSILIAQRRWRIKKFLLSFWSIVIYQLMIRNSWNIQKISYLEHKFDTYKINITWTLGQPDTLPYIILFNVDIIFKIVSILFFVIILFICLKVCCFCLN